MFKLPPQFRSRDTSLYKLGVTHPILPHKQGGAGISFYIWDNILHINIFFPKIDDEFGNFLQFSAFRCGVITKGNIPYVVFDWGFDNHRQMGYFNCHDMSDAQLNSWLSSTSRMTYIAYSHSKTATIKGFRAINLPSDFFRELRTAILISKAVYRNTHAIERQIYDDVQKDIYEYLLKNVPLHIVIPGLTR
ncbi:hypothetical protein HGH93_21690 [Chitinophaga polysaccharea]|uniref:hypothetical protein n=1 Tax=Chitinophaga polysaccharea TaxID=1293035 RepID=UPI0014551E92|nr:hypothetical protein [Chitinophaga polysaccharea]NLR60738.1 hypothetical protein [Chitinophaga polysaccharea]